MRTISFSAAAEVETPNHRTTWGHRAAIADRARQAIRVAVPPRPDYPRYFVTVTRVGPATLDDDNLVAACKAVRDELAHWLGLDDADPRIHFAYHQRKETVVDTSPRPRRKHRTWVEITVADEPSAPAAIEAPPPERLEREKVRPPVRVDQGRPPLHSLEVGSNGLRVELCESPDGVYVRVCKHFTQQGHAWRTAGVAVPLADLDATIAALKKIVRKT